MGKKIKDKNRYKVLKFIKKQKVMLQKRKEERIILQSKSE